MSKRLTLAQKDNLLSRAATIRDERMEKANTASRVGSLLYDMVDELDGEILAEQVIIDNTNVEAKIHALDTEHLAHVRAFGDFQAEVYGSIRWK